MLEKYMPLDTHQILRPIKRNHVNIFFSKYKRTKIAQMSERKSYPADEDCEENYRNVSATLGQGYSWEPVVKDLAEYVKDHITICFVDFQKDAQQIALDFCEADVPARFLVGGNMQADEKQKSLACFQIWGR